MANKIARVIVTQRCPRKCPGCCNEQFEFDGDVEELTSADAWSRLTAYNTVVLSGGEPLLVSKELRKFITECPQEKKFVLYTAYSTLVPEQKMVSLLSLLCGITYTIHYETWQKDLKELATIQVLLRNRRSAESAFDARLSVDDRISHAVFSHIDTNCWSSVKTFKWLKPEECSIPDSEDLFYLPLG